MVTRALSNPWLIFGVVLQASFFFIYLLLLSRADVSLVLPLTAIDYIVVAVLAQYMLGEIGHAGPVGRHGPDRGRRGSAIEDVRADGQRAAARPRS